jgi:hypothetical protein
MQTKPDSNTLPDESQLIAAARAGESSGLVVYLYERCLMGRALRLVAGFRSAYGVRLDAEDVALVGVEQVLRKMEKALAEAMNPIAWLVHAAQMKMLAYCKEQRSVIRVPSSSQWYGKPVPYVASLDAPLAAGSDCSLLDVLSSSLNEFPMSSQPGNQRRVSHAC